MRYRPAKLTDGVLLPRDPVEPFLGRCDSVNEAARIKVSATSVLCNARSDKAMAHLLPSAASFACRSNVLLQRAISLSGLATVDFKVSVSLEVRGFCSGSLDMVYGTFVMYTTESLL